MAIVKIVVKDIGVGNENFEFSCDSYPAITDEQRKDINKLSLAQYVALKVLEYMDNGLDKGESKSEKLFKNAHKSDKGFH